MRGFAKQSYHNWISKFKEIARPDEPFRRASRSLAMTGVKGDDLQLNFLSSAKLHQIALDEIVQFAVHYGLYVGGFVVSTKVFH